jgi:hypothetical protein
MSSKFTEQETAEWPGKYLPHLHDRSSSGEYSSHRYCSNNPIAVEIESEINKYKDIPIPDKIKESLPNYNEQGIVRTHEYNYFKAIGCKLTDKKVSIPGANPNFWATQCEIDAAKNRLKAKLRGMNP